MSDEKTKVQEFKKPVTMRMPPEMLQTLKDNFKELEFTPESSGYEIIDEVCTKILKVTRVNKKMTSRTMAKKKMTPEEFEKIEAQRKEAELKFWEDQLKD